MRDQRTVFEFRIRLSSKCTTQIYAYRLTAQAISQGATAKLQHWRGLQSIYARKAAPMLGFVGASMLTKK